MDLTADEVLQFMIDLLEYHLEELNGMEGDPFSLGEKYAYVECLEFIQNWKYSEICGLTYDIEKRFPLDFNLPFALKK